MEIDLGNAIAKEGCCVTDDCECMKNGIGCQADSCSCWYPQHQSNNSHIPVTELPTPEIIKSTCGNKHGMYVVEYHNIQNHRREVLGKEHNESLVEKHV